MMRGSGRDLLVRTIALGPAFFVGGVALRFYEVDATALLMALIGTGNVAAAAGMLARSLHAEAPPFHLREAAFLLAAPTAIALAALVRYLVLVGRARAQAGGRQRSAAPWPVVLALPLVGGVLYSDISEVLIVRFGAPSLLQALLLASAAVIWVHRDALAPAPILAHPLTGLLAAYCAVVFVSTVWAEDVALADAQAVKTLKNLAIYLIAAMLAASWTALRRCLVTMALVAGALSLVSLVQIGTGRTFGGLGGLATVAYGNIYGSAIDMRAAGPVNDANFYGQILVMVVPLALSLATAATRRSSRIFWAAVAMLIVAGVLTTYSRGAMLALLVMTAIVLASMRVRASRIALGTAAMAGLLLLIPGNVGRRLMTFETLLPRQTYFVPPDSSFEKRKLLLSTTVGMFADHPILGVGAGNFTTFFPQYSNAAGSPAEHFYRSGEIEHPHSLVLEVAAETGALGLFVFLAAVATAFASLRGARQSLIAGGRGRPEMHVVLGLAMALCAYLVTSVFLHGYTQRYFWLLLALAAAAARLVAAERRDAPPAETAMTGFPFPSGAAAA